MAPEAARVPAVEVPSLEELLGSALSVLLDLDNPRIRPFRSSDPEALQSDTWGNSILEHVGAALHTLACKLLRDGESKVVGRLLLQDYDGTGVLRPPTDAEAGRAVLCYRRSTYQPVPSLLLRGKPHTAVLKGVHKWSEGFTYFKSARDMEPLVWQEVGYADSLARVRGTSVPPQVFTWVAGVMARVGTDVPVGLVPRMDAMARRAAQDAAEDVPGVSGSPPMRALASMGPAETAWLDSLWEWSESRQREA